jgi:integrase
MAPCRGEEAGVSPEPTFRVGADDPCGTCGHARSLHWQGAFCDWMANEDSRYTTAAGFPIHGTNILPPFRRALAAAGLPKVRLHDLRHAYAAIMLGAGVPLIVVSRTLGHSSIRITADIYSEVVPELYSDAAAKLAEALR